MTSVYPKIHAETETEGLVKKKDMPLLLVSYKRRLLIPKIRYSILFSTLRTELKTPRNSQTSQVRASPEKQTKQRTTLNIENTSDVLHHAGPVFTTQVANTRQM